MKDFLDELLIVLVIYKMKITESPAYHSLTTCLAANDDRVSLFVYDNSPLAQQPPNDQSWSLSYVHDPANPGVSKAYNRGLQLAKEKKKKWMLLVDQDTLFPTNCFVEYSKRATKCSIIVPVLKDNFGNVSPLQFYFGGGQRVKDFRAKSILPLGDFLFHNSGLLIETEAFEATGGYDEQLPLDFSDFAFVHRLRHHYNEFALADFYCIHRLAATEATSLDERLSRFESYVTAGKYFKRNYAATNSLLLPRIFLRRIKLCLQYRTFKFMKSFSAP